MKTNRIYVVAVILSVASAGFMVRHLHDSVEPPKDKAQIASKVPQSKRPTIEPKATATDLKEVSAAIPSASSPSVDDLTASFRAMPDEDLKGKLAELTQKIKGENWIDRANRRELTTDGMNQLEALLNTELAAKIVLLERDVERVKDKYL